MIGRITRLRVAMGIVLGSALEGCSLLGSASSHFDELPKDAEASLVLAQRDIAERKEEAALEILDQLVREYPNNVRVHRDYQDLRIKLGDSTQVRDEYQKRAVEQGDALSLLLFARVIENPEQRRAQIALAVERDPRLHWAYLARGNELARDGKYSEAREDFRHASLLASPFPEALRREAEMSIELGEFAEAIEVLQTSLESNPDDTAAHYNLASCLSRVGRNAEAAEEFRKAIELDPRDRNAMLGLGNAYLRDQKIDEAAAIYRELARQNPTDPEPYYDLAILYEEYNLDPVSAVAAYRKYLELGGKESLRVERWIQRLTGEKR